MTELNREAKPATDFDEDDVPNDLRLDGLETRRNFYNRLRVRHSHNWDGKRISETRKTKKDTSEILDAIASQMELTDYQKAQAHRAFSNLPSVYNDSTSTALLALCTCSLVANEDGRAYHPHQLRPESRKSNKFVELADELGVSYTRVYKCWTKLQSEVG